MSTVIIGLVVALALFFAGRKIYKDRKSSKSCGNCASCTSCASCNKKKAK